MQVNSTIYYGRKVHTKAVPSIGYVSNVPVLPYYAISQPYAFKAYKTHPLPMLDSSTTGQSPSPAIRSRFTKKHTPPTIATATFE